LLSEMSKNSGYIPAYRSKLPGQWSQCCIVLCQI